MEYGHLSFKAILTELLRMVLANEILEVPTAFAEDSIGRLRIVSCCQLHLEQEKVLFCASKLHIFPDGLYAMAHCCVLHLIIDTEHDIRTLNGRFVTSEVPSSPETFR